MGKTATLAWERRWARTVGLVTFAAVISLGASIIVAHSLATSGGEADSLRKLHDHHGALMLSSILRGVGLLLLVAPLVYLFRAASARSEQMRRQFIGLVIAAPILLSAGSILSVSQTSDAASEFVAGKVEPQLTVKEAAGECRDEQREDQSGFKEEFGGGPAGLGACRDEKREDDAAKQAVTGSAGQTLVGVAQIAGGLGFVFALAYSSLYAMRVGLLTRLWGSLGIGLAVAFLLGQLALLTVLWFVYFGLLCCGWLPRGRPPAWAAGEAIPWPTPGEVAAGELEGGSEPAEGEQTQAIPEPDIPREGDTAEPGEPSEPGESGPPRKRKRRDTGGSAGDGETDGD